MAAKKAGGGSDRLSYTEAMEKTIREIGDIDEFVNAEDVIVLKADEPLPAECHIPSQLAVDADRTRLTTNCEGLAGCLQFLAKYRYPSVLLAGLPKLASAPSFRTAARKVLCGTQTLIIVHNREVRRYAANLLTTEVLKAPSPGDRRNGPRRDCILDLAGWFDCPTFMLYHDLYVHQGIRLLDLDGFLHLVAVYGTTPALGCDQLYISVESMLSLVANSGKLSMLQAPMGEAVLMASMSDMMHGRKLASQVLLFEQCEEMTLGLHVYSRWGDARTIGPLASVDVVKSALAHCPNPRRLKVTTDSKEVFPLIAKFSQLVRLSVVYVGEEQWLPFDPNVTHLLRSLPSLTHLALTNFEDVSLSTIDKTCRNLQSLTLATSTFANERIDPNAFPKLTSLTVGDFLTDQVFNGLVQCALFTVTDLCIEGAIYCEEFIAYPCSLPFRCLQRLTLKMDKPLLTTRASPENLHTLFGRMPALEQLTTDSYDIRLFVQCYHPRVKLDWTQCTVCNTEYPKVNAVQEKVWREVHACV